MEAETTTAVRDLLQEAGAAHAVYERDELAGVRDEAWPAWYAAYLLDHGLVELLPGVEDADDLAAMLEELDADYRREQPADGWPEFYAARMAAAWG
jgi:hypothetical protein